MRPGKANQKHKPGLNFGVGFLLQQQQESQGQCEMWRLDPTEKDHNTHIGCNQNIVTASRTVRLPPDSLNWFTSHPTPRQTGLWLSPLAAIYLGLAEKKRNAPVIRLVEVLPGHKRQENEVKLEIVVHR